MEGETQVPCIRGHIGTITVMELLLRLISVHHCKHNKADYYLGVNNLKVRVGVFHLVSTAFNGVSTKCDVYFYRFELLQVVCIMQSAVCLIGDGTCTCCSVYEKLVQCAVNCTGT